MRVLFVDQFSDWGGAQLGLRDVMTEGLRRGWSVSLMAPACPLTDFCVRRGIAVKPLPLGRHANGAKTWRDAPRFIPDTIRCGRAIRRSVEEDRIDLVTANGPRILPAAVGAGCPIVFYAHSSPQKRYARTLARWCSQRNGTSVIAVSRFAAKWIQPGTVRVIYNGVKDQGYRAQPPGGAPPRIGIVGRIAPEKGQVDFIRAARGIAAAHPNARFVVVGAALFSSASYELGVRRMAEDLPVEFPGWTDDVGATLRSLDILAVPSSSIEAATRVIMEAFSAGTPVVAYPSGGIPELVRDGETGILTASADYRSLRSGIEGLLSDSAMMARLALNGRREWEARFRLDRFQADICDSLEQAATIRSAPPAEGVAPQVRERADVIPGALGD